ncbi:hypothetical protein I4I73_15880 [Pseudonocardia sp. KRD-184]|uniref:Uncharacterized protein n=1 Tax=Pseudonocardia oceani TaxID=2792013 RepID=A0ABS6U8P6_9PSEU|nr:hypothetical protein [Pseudonocardia oceani]MBW0090255.1 hypothetical protein [Pseudonocardia oceani]MBW0097461.1 hypothetical protein [Pseudonocardia oceani]MBW0109696.1 hypothetical protein [Pseudonocardia oceani]MBW0122053.1 hypothetical protein [Pseudonocardia oceani]MBW0128353.1 hypothetical protein [Pseudonocardia oceani]
MSIHVTGVGPTDTTPREHDIASALVRLRSAFDPDPDSRERAKQRLMMVLTAMDAGSSAHRRGTCGGASFAC